MRRAWLSFLVVLALDGCSSKSDPAPAPTNTQPIAHYTLPATGPIPFDAIPFPNDLHLSASGTIDLKSMPRALHDEPVWAATLELLATRRGFCVTCAVHFPIDGELKTVPSAIDAPTAADPIVFVDVDPASPDKGKLLPIRVQWDADEHRLSVRTAEGRVLIRKRKYAVALTTAIGAVSPSPTFLAARDGGGDASAARARVIVAPALDALAAAGIPRNRVVALASFTTDDVLADAAAARALVTKAQRPTAVVDLVFDAAKLDELLGTPAEKLPGMQRPSIDPTKGQYAVLHESIALAIVGHFRAPRVRDGKGVEIGLALRDSSGALMAGELEDVNFLLTIPKGVDLAKLPVVVFHTGLSGTVGNAFGIADSIAKSGAATLSIEPALHGARAATATDTKNAFRDLPGKDGFSEHEGDDVGARFLGVVGAAPGKKGSPGYLLGIGLQQTADAFMAIRLVRDGDLSALRVADPTLSTLAFDPTRIAWTGLSNGSVVGSKIVALEPNLAAAVLNVPPASLAESGFMSPGFRELIGLLLRPLVLIPDASVDKDLRLDPALDFYRWTIEPVEPLAIAPYLVTARSVDGPPPDVLVQQADHDELVLPLLADAFSSALGIPGVGNFVGAKVQSAALPMLSNVTSGTATITAGSVRFPAAMHVMLFAIQEDSKWAEPLLPPFKLRPTVVSIKNPVVAVQKQIETFFRTRFQSGHAKIE